MGDDEIIKNIKLVDIKDTWMGRGIKTVDVNDDCESIKNIFDEGHEGVLVSEINEFGETETVGWIVKEKFIENFNKNQECKAGDVMIKNFEKISPATTLLGVKIKLQKNNISALPVITVHGGHEIALGYLCMKDIEEYIEKHRR